MADKPFTQDYAITLTISNKLRKATEDPVAQYQALKEAIIMLRQEFCDDIKITIVPELTKNYDVHLHGIISIALANATYKKYSCNIDYMIHRITRSKRYNTVFGFCMMKPITDWDVWVAYVKKSLQETNKIIKLDYMYNEKLPVFICDDYNIIKPTIFDFLKPSEIEDIKRSDILERLIS